MTPLIEARGVTKILERSRTGHPGKGINLAIMPREFVAITGPSGSGKSSLLYLLGLLDLPTIGDVLIDGRSTDLMSEDERAEVRLNPDRVRLPVSFLAAGIQHHRECRAADARAGQIVGARRHAHARRNC